MTKCKWLGTLNCSLLVFALVSVSQTQASETKLCSDVKIRSEQTVSFSANEELFICGDSQTKEWSEIPHWQKKNHLKAILQAKGFFLTNSQ